MVINTHQVQGDLELVSVSRRHETHTFTAIAIAMWQSYSNLIAVFTVDSVSCSVEDNNKGGWARLDAPRKDILRVDGQNFILRKICHLKP